MVTKSESPKPKTKTSPKDQPKTVKTPVISSELDSEQLASLKAELKTYLDDKLEDRLLDKIEKTNKLLLREKSRKIWFRNLLILILIALVGFETCVLYNRGFFDTFLNRTKTEPILSADGNVANSADSNASTSEKMPTLDELKQKHAGLLSPFRISKDSIYFSDYNSGNLTNELKLYFALNSLNFDNLEVEEDYNLIPASALESAFKNLFDASDFNPVSFDYNGNRLRYLKPLEAFVSTELLKKPSDSLISLEISEIKEDEQKVTIKTSTGLAFNFNNKKLSSLSKN